jgi:hypothetical protein
MMEYWNAGKLGNAFQQSQVFILNDINPIIDPLFQYSIIPRFQKKDLELSGDVEKIGI